ncbi:MAG: tripartite tricarboxylate transporter substrate binding protein, partial [Burkholderiales bacterium]|nr:tripartite tricarboxylate transporter substrate binding protein [Burkholderiales bacterium]
MPRTLTSGLYAALALAASLAGPPASAQDRFPSRPVRIVVGSEAGSAPDILA